MPGNIGEDARFYESAKMEPILLMLEVIAISQVLVWTVRARGSSGFLGWKSDEAPPADGRKMRPRRAAMKGRKG